MKLPEHLQRVFRRDSETGNFVVEILLEKYLYAFNEWDSSFFKRRDIDPDLVDYLENCSDLIPGKFDMDLVFTVSQQPDESMEKTLRDSIANFFGFNLYMQKQELFRLYRKSFFYIGLSLSFLFVAVFSEAVLSNNPLSRTVLEGMFIGGWVFLWEAISQLSFNRGGLAQKIMEYRRLSRARVIFVYRATNSPALVAQVTGVPRADEKKQTLAKPENAPGGEI